uniref:Uncharacterized protein n=1 Tax=Nelumbo nucifera TaxID=4432 RepID=A0A822ZUU1_NELNU|nr:TPA_asm: hypothetical protein HUJ06_003888 [Nelumbo nucifera]
MAATVPFSFCINPPHHHDHQPPFSLGTRIFKRHILPICIDTPKPAHPLLLVHKLDTCIFRPSFSSSSSSSSHSSSESSSSSLPPPASYYHISTTYREQVDFQVTMNSSSSKCYRASNIPINLIWGRGCTRVGSLGIVCRVHGAAFPLYPSTSILGEAVHDWTKSSNAAHSNSNHVSSRDMINIRNSNRILQRR